MKLTIFAGDLADAPAEALVTSTNPRLTLVMGTGAAVRARGGFEILRACEAIVEAERQRSGRDALPPGSAHVTTAGSLRAKVVIHCVASDLEHRSSPAIVSACVRNALARATEAGCASVAIPVFATGHAHLKFDGALDAMAPALRDAPAAPDHVVIVIDDASRSDATRKILTRHLPGVHIDVVRSEADEPRGWLDFD